MPPDLTNDLDIQIELNDLRTLVLSGQRLPAERYRQLIDSIRDTRENASRIAAANRVRDLLVRVDGQARRKATKSRAKATAAQIDLDRLFTS